MCYLTVAAGVLGFGIWVIMDGVSAGEVIQPAMIGMPCVVLSLGIAREAIELCSVSIDDGGIEQLKLFHKGGFMVRTRIAWGEVRSCRVRGMWVHLTSASSDVRVDLSTFNNMDEARMSLQRRLPLSARWERR